MDTNNQGGYTPRQGGYSQQDEYSQRQGYIHSAKAIINSSNADTTNRVIRSKDTHSKDIINSSNADILSRDTLSKVIRSRDIINSSNAGMLSRDTINSSSADILSRRDSLRDSRARAETHGSRAVSHRARKAAKSAESTKTAS